MSDLEFVGEIPSWMDADLTGHPYTVPPPDICLTPHCGLFERASAVVAFASEKLKSDLEGALLGLSKINMPPHPDLKDTLLMLETKFPDLNEDKIWKTPQGKAWQTWFNARNVIRPCHRLIQSSAAAR